MHRALSPHASWRAALAAVALAALAPAACNGDKGSQAAGGGWVVDTASVSGTSVPRVDSARVDLYLDATVSMAGYVADPNSRYASFLRELEAATQAAWRRAEVNFYKFGATSAKIDRADFVNAPRSPGFFAERITGIDQVVDCGAPGRVTVVLTDLFQSAGDVNAIVGRIKTRCFQHGRSAAVLGVRSQFDGTVYDANVPPFRYASGADTATYRPFYALMLGDAPAVERLLAALGEQAGAAGRSYVVIAPHVVRRYEVAMRKAPRSNELNAQKPTSPYQFNFALLPKQSTGRLIADVVVTESAPGALPVRADQLELVAYRRPAPGSAAGDVGGGRGARADSGETRDITLERPPERVGDTLRLALRLNLADPPGTYTYKLVLRAGAAGSFGNPPWVERYSSSNPTLSADPNKTLNLARFVLDLRRASTSVTRPAVAIWYLTVRKR